MTNPEERGNDDDEMTSLSRRVQRMDLSRLPERLAALDEEQRRRDGAAGAEFGGGVLDTSAAAEALRELKACAEGEGMTAAVEAREDALGALRDEVQVKLAARGMKEALGQGLRRLEDAVYRAREFEVSDDALVQATDVEALRSAFNAFDEELRATQAAARELLSRELGLRMMPDQTGETLDAALHNVIASISGEDLARDNTVAREEAPVWMLSEEVLSRADVVRYSGRRKAEDTS